MGGGHVLDDMEQVVGVSSQLSVVGTRAGGVGGGAGYRAGNGGRWGAGYRAGGVGGGAGYRAGNGGRWGGRISSRQWG